MPLSFTDDVLEKVDEYRYRAIGSKNDEMIIVVASHESVQDYGEQKVKQKASDKYDSDEVTENRVTVRTADFEK